MIEGSPKKRREEAEQEAAGKANQRIIVRPDTPH